MRSNILKPGKLLLGTAIVAVASSVIWSCTLEPYIITAEEQYTRNFIKDFGLVDPNQDWNLAKAATVKVNLGDNKFSSVKIYGKHGDNFYLIADLTDISGKIDVPVDVPESCSEIMVKAGGRKYYGSLDSTIDCTDLSRGVPDGEEYKDRDTNPNSAVYEETIKGYSIKVQHTDKGNAEGTVYAKYNDNGAYQYFNTQQMSPIISTTTWDTYYSENTKKWTENPGNWIGLLPESGVFNRLQSELNSWLNVKKAEGQSIVEDFRIATGDDGSFTLFPYYYGTNLKHELGVYLLDDNGNPLLKSGTYSSSNASNYKLDDFISFPVFVDRAPGDLQVQPHYDDKIDSIRLKDGNPEFVLGENFDLQAQVQIKRKEDGWISYNDYIKQYGKEFHSRVAYHFWIDEPNSNMKENPDSFARIYNNGIVTPLKLTKDHNDEGIAYANVAIATGLENSSLGAGIGRIQGVEQNFTYKVIQAGTVKSIDIAETELKMCIGETRELTVTLKDKNGNALSLADYFDEISVTEWDNDICKIYKDESTKTIKLEAVGSGECWPRVFQTASDWDGIFDYVHVLTSPHHITKEYIWPSDDNTEENTVPSDVINKWPNYFELSDEYKKDVTKELFSEASEEENWARTYTDEAGRWEIRKLDKNVFTDADNTYKLRFKIDKSHQLIIRPGWWNNPVGYYYYVGDSKYSSDNDYKTIAATEFEILLSDEMLTLFKEQGISIQNASEENVTFLKVQMVRPVKEGEEVHDWSATGQTDATGYLATYYTGKAGTTCDYCGNTFNFASITPTVTIMDDAVYDKIHYKVTWEQQAGTYSVSKHRPSARSRSVSSREYHDDSSKFLEPNGEWKDVNSFWSRLLPHQEEVASYPPNVPMLARSRGYDVTITYGTDEKGEPKPWKGNLGMYLKVLGSYDIVDTSSDFSGDYKDTYTLYTEGNSDKYKQEYVVFSQKRFNKGADGKTSEQISALSVKHPMSGRTFLTFEDMRVTRNDVTPADFYKEKSSDRDVNDLIFNITNYGSISNDKEEIVEKESEEGFSWLWAVEDLGATDDFDFNDMVMKITSVTKNKTITPAGTDGNDTSTTETTTTDTEGIVILYKKVTFTPLCAGGTLPLYVHYNDYILRPGVYQEEDLDYVITDAGLKNVTPADISVLTSSDPSSEIHKWFGDYQHTTMINTSGDKIRANSCVLYLNTEFTIEGFGSTSTNTSAEGGADGIGGLSVTVNDDRVTQMGNISADWNEEGGSWVITPAENGKVSQMFMVHDAKAKWRWPTERTHILEVYPKFKDWVKDKSTNDKWYDDCKDSNKVIERYDLK